MSRHRFGIKELPVKGSHSIGLQSMFGLRLKPSAEIVEPVITPAGFLYTIDKRTIEDPNYNYQFYFLEYDSVTGALIRESLITNLDQYTSNLFLAADSGSLFVMDPGYSRVHKYSRRTLGYVATVTAGWGFYYPGWPYQCGASTAVMFAGDAASLYIVFQYGGRDESGNGNWSSWLGAVMRIRKSDLVIQDFAEAVFASGSTPSENSTVVGNYFVVKYSAKVLMRYNTGDLSIRDDSPDLGYTIHRPFADSTGLYVYTYGRILQIDPETWDILQDVEIPDPPINTPSIAVDDTEFIYMKTLTELQRYNKPDFTMDKILSSEIASSTIRLAIVNP
jgi:hypothetical protein